MIRSLYTAVSGMISLENKQNTVVNNMANANTTGFKSDNLVLKSFKDVMIQNRDKIVGGTNKTQKLGTISLGTAIDTVSTTFTQGDIQQTSENGDFAIDGRGFFAIQSGDKVYYSRDGKFRVNKEGYLVNCSGDNVLGFNSRTGVMEAIRINSSKFELDPETNSLKVGDTPVYKLALADFEDYTTLTKVGDNYYEGVNPTYAAPIYVKQGCLESSNVNITNEMVDMITVMRNFETCQRCVTMLDESLGKAANEIGAVR